MYLAYSRNLFRGSPGNIVDQIAESSSSGAAKFPASFASASQYPSNIVLPTASSQFLPCQDPNGIASALTKSMSEVTFRNPKNSFRLGVRYELCSLRMESIDVT